MAKFDYGWIDDPNNKINPKPNKAFGKDLVIGLGITLIGVGYIAYSSFAHGAKAYELAELKVLDSLGKLL